MLDTLTFHHIGIATDSIEKTAQFYLSCGYAISDCIYDPIQKVNISFLTKDGMPQIELLEPVDDTSPVAQTIKKNGVTPYHFCYEVEDMDITISELRKHKFLILSAPVEAIAINKRKICFLYKKTVGLIELVEKQR